MTATFANPVDRRDVLSGGAALGAASALASLAPPPAAAREAGGPQGPGFHRLKLGAAEITVLSDGHMLVPPRFLAGNVPDATVDAFLDARKITGDRVSFNLNIACVRMGSEVVLIDAGAGGTWEPTAGRLADSLAAAGLKPDAITTVVLSHGHPDHLWGLVDDLDDSLRFPKARYLVPIREHEFWLGDADKLRGPIEGMTAGAKRVLKAIDSRLTRFMPGAEILPGIAALDTAGHTPGHVSFLIGSGPERLVVTADAVQNAHISLAHPDWQPRADMDGDKGAQSRRRLIEMAAADKAMVLGYHLPFPGLGRVERKGSAFVWVPAA